MTLGAIMKAHPMGLAISSSLNFSPLSTASGETRNTGLQRPKVAESPSFPDFLTNCSIGWRLNRSKFWSSGTKSEVLHSAINAGERCGPWHL